MQDNIAQGFELDAVIWIETTMTDLRIERSGPEIAANVSLDGSDLQGLPLSRLVQVVSFLVAVATLTIAVTSSPSVNALAFSRDGKILIGAVNGFPWFNLRDMLHSYGSIKVWDTDTGRPRATLTGPGVWLRSIAISPDGSTLAVAGDSHSIELWDAYRWRRKRVLEGGPSSVGEVAFAPTGAVLASAGYDDTVRVWDLASRDWPLPVKVIGYGVRDLCFAPDGRALAMAGSAGVGFYSTRDGPLVRETRGDRLGFLGFIDGGRNHLLVRYSARHNLRKTVLDGATHAERFVARPFSHSRPKLSSDGSSIAFGDWSGAVSVVDASSGRELARCSGLSGDVRSLAFSPDAKLLAAGDERGTVCVWDASTGRMRARFNCDSFVRRFIPAAAAFFVCGLATLRFCWAKRFGIRGRRNRLWNRFGCAESDQVPARAQAEGKALAVPAQATSAGVDGAAMREPLWDHWLDG
jgi:WD domain, G-beta repeat